MPPLIDFKLAAATADIDTHQCQGRLPGTLSPSQAWQAHTGRHMPPTPEPPMLRYAKWARSALLVCLKKKSQLENAAVTAELFLWKKLL